MPIYYLNDKLTIKVEGEMTQLEAFSLQGLNTLGEKSISQLIERGLIRELKTPPLSYFEPLEQYDTMLIEAGFNNLGDIAGAYPQDLPEEVRPYFDEIRALLNPDKPQAFLDPCCGN